MSEPIRYTGKTKGSLLGSPHWEHPKGEWVKWEDYANLKAQVERLRSSSFVTAVPVEQYERLRKAGDELHAFLINYIVDNRISSAYLNKLDDGWLAAKEGKPSV